MTVAFEENQYYNLTGQFAACWATYSDQSKYFYAANSQSHTISEITYDANAVLSTVSTLSTPSALITDVIVMNVNGIDYLMGNGANVFN